MLGRLVCTVVGHKPKLVGKKVGFMLWRSWTYCSRCHTRLSEYREVPLPGTADVTGAKQLPQ